MNELAKQLQQLQAQVQTAMGKLGVEQSAAKLAGLEQQMQQADFWNDAQQAARISQQAAGLKRHVEQWQGLERQVGEALELAQTGDASLQGEIAANYQTLAKQYQAREFELKLSGEHDASGAVVTINAGTGGTDAQDWAEMLLRMYLRYCEQQGWASALLDQSPGEEAGIKSATVEVNGAFAYGKLKAERGVHRLVRLSPYNADNLRQTSFAMVEVVPQIETDALEINPEELRVDVFRAGGHGGQSVNTTDSAVRITHLPTGVTVAIQNERSQLQNKEKALQILRARLTLLLEEQHKERLSELRGANVAAAWGNQIRSYVLHPYTKVKDHRTGHETSQAQAVLDGALEPFIEAYLQQQIGTT